MESQCMSQKLQSAICRICMSQNLERSFSKQPASESASPNKSCDASHTTF